MSEVLAPLPRISGTAERIAAAAGLGAFALGSAVVWYFDPTTAGFFPTCPLYKFTGFACPGCGLTRAFHALFHGDVLTALDFNALLPLIIVFFGYILLSLFFVAFRGRGLAFGKYGLTLIWVTFSLLIIFGVLRNLPWYPFTVLFP